MRTMSPCVPPPPSLDHLIALERELQSPGCRADQARLRELLAPDFVEIGASGRRWDLESTLRMLRDESGLAAANPIEMSDLTARVLAAGVVQVFWVSERAGRRARRTSLWCERESGWQQVFHQGTLL